MTILTVRHLTRYRYARNVSFGEHRMMFRPRESFDQHVLESVLTITPRPVDIRYVHDVFGNCIGIARFKTRAKELVFESINRLEHHPEASLDHPDSHRGERNAFPFVYDAVDEPDLLPSRERIYPDPGRELEEWSRRFLVGLTMQDAPHILAAMTLAIHDEHKYQTRLSGPPQSPVETLRVGSGTCRDFAVLMMEACRTLGLAARFVSGYLYAPQRDGHQQLKGGGNTHAWVRVFLPSGGWAEFDPTNGLVGNRDLIRVAVVRDPAQAVPLSGTWDGESSDYLGMDVEVDVTAEEPGDRGGKRVVRMR
jgi:Transglutaminase-like superfamily/Bacterial transglutaminase-like N-terminal region